MIKNLKDFIGYLEQKNIINTTHLESKESVNQLIHDLMKLDLSKFAGVQSLASPKTRKKKKESRNVNVSINRDGSSQRSSESRRKSKQPSVNVAIQNNNIYFAPVEVKNKEVLQHYYQRSQPQSAPHSKERKPKQVVRKNRSLGSQASPTNSHYYEGAGSS